jgi:uncharacterized protein YutD
VGSGTGREDGFFKQQNAKKMMKTQEEVMSNKLIQFCNAVILRKC